MQKIYSRRSLLAGIALIVIAVTCATHPAVADETKRTNAFFAFDNGVGIGRWSPPEQAEILKSLGYEGIGYTGVGGLAERLSAMNSQGLRVFNLYVQCTPGATPSFPSSLLEAIEQLEGTGVMLWLTVLGKTNDDDAARVVQEIADVAKRHGVKIALYPHHGFHVATATDALRLLKKIDRGNIGITINLCHELKAGNAAKFDEIIQATARHLYFVSINGADREGRDWGRLIQPLGEGDFDVPAFLRHLKAAGYTGPIGLQCYGVKGNQKENLKQSMMAWKKMSHNALQK